MMDLLIMVVTEEYESLVELSVCRQFVVDHLHGSLGIRLFKS
jgi:hypothetical protein